MVTDSEIRAWFKSRGEPVSVKGPLSNALRLQYAAAHGNVSVIPLPGPDELDDLPPESFGPTINVDIDPESTSTPGPGPAPVLPGPGPDEPPKHAGREWRSKPRSKPRSSKPKSTPSRVTAGVRQDITGQIGFLLQVPGSIWAARDPLCGGTFVQQLPDIADSLADWVVDSPGLLALFTGPGGSWIVKAVKTAAALAPVVSVTMAHHVYHTVETGEAPQPDYPQYAA